MPRKVFHLRHQRLLARRRQGASLVTIRAPVSITFSTSLPALPNTPNQAVDPASAASIVGSHLALSVVTRSRFQGHAAMRLLTPADHQVLATFATGCRSLTSLRPTPSTHSRRGSSTARTSLGMAAASIFEEGALFATVLKRPSRRERAAAPCPRSGECPELRSVWPFSRYFQSNALRHA